MRARWFTALLVLAAALGLALRMQDVGRESLWYDEVYQFWWTQQPLRPFLIQRWTMIDPPLNDVIAWGWNGATRRWAPAHATDEAAIRAPAVAFGAATVVVAGLTARAAFGPTAGIVGAFLLATNPYHLRYSQEARMYALTTLLATVAMLFLVRTLDRGRARDATGFGVFAAAAVYAHYFALVPLALASATTYALARRDGSERVRALLRGELLGLALSAPYVAAQAVLSIVNHHGRRAWLKKLGPPTLGTIVRTARLYATDNLGRLVAAHASPADVLLVGGAPLALALLLLLGIAARRPDEPRHLRPHLLAIAFGSLAAVLLVSELRPIFHPRYLLCTFPALLLLLVRARPARLVAAIALVPIACGTLVEPRDHERMLKPDYRDAAAALVRMFEPGDAVDVHDLDERPLWHYARLATAADSPVVTAITHGGRSDTRSEAAEARWRRTIAAGRRIFEVDVSLPPGTSGAGPRRQVASPAEGRRLVFESEPLPYIRLWARDALPPSEGSPARRDE